MARAIPAAKALLGCAGGRYSICRRKRIGDGNFLLYARVTFKCFKCLHHHSFDATRHAAAALNCIAASILEANKQMTIADINLFIFLPCVRVCFSLAHLYGCRLYVHESAASFTSQNHLHRKYVRFLPEIDLRHQHAQNLLAPFRSALFLCQIYLSHRPDARLT